MKIGFTGTRFGMSATQIEWLEEFFKTHDVTQFHHGDCVGADEEAHKIADKVFGIKTFVHPPINEKHRAYCLGDVIYLAKPYMERNKDIVLATDKLVAMPRTVGETNRSGTWSTVRYARKTHKDIHMVPP